jgi:hypothetical protein
MPPNAMATGPAALVPVAVAIALDAVHDDLASAARGGIRG